MIESKHAWMAFILMVSMHGYPSEPDRAAKETARMEAERNAATAEGKRYLDSLSVYFAAAHTSTLGKCLDSTRHPDAAAFEIFLKLNRRGGVKEIFPDRDVPLAACVMGKIRADAFPAPPAPNYWIGLPVKLPGRPPIGR